MKIHQNFQFLFCKFLRKNISSFQRSVMWFSFNTLLIKKGMKLFLYLLIYIDCKTVGFFLKISKEIGKAWRKSLTRAKRVRLIFSVSPQSRSLFSASFQTSCLTARAYLNMQKYGLFCSLSFILKGRSCYKSTGKWFHLNGHTIRFWPQVKWSWQGLL